ncbi:hypothetical protein NEOKW01_0798 [Nematocida sp. AWRm80]|nr:hypothetical protein NEOKW01_0798 [Nematocida sp. AWRm80]
MSQINLSVVPVMDSGILVQVPEEYVGAEYKNGYLYSDKENTLKEVKLTKTSYDTNCYIGELTNDSLILTTKAESVLVPGLADFLLPSFSEAQPFYSGLQNSLSMERDSTPEEYFNEYIKKNKSIPFYPLPVITLTGIFKYYNFKEFKTVKSIVRLATKIEIEDTPPEKIDPETEKTVKNMIKKDYSQLKSLFQKAFLEQPIWSIKQIHSYIEANSDLLQRHKWTTIKNILSVIAYTYTTGPWKKLWIRRGYNPTLDPSAYKYQVYVWKNVSKAFVIIDNPELFKAIKETPSFTTTEFNKRTGYLTTEAYDYIHQKLSEISVPKAEPKGSGPSLLSNLDFELPEE